MKQPCDEGVIQSTSQSGKLVLPRMKSAGRWVLVVPLTTAVMGSVDSQRAGIASGINNAVARTAGLLAIAALGIVALATFSASLDSNLNALALPPGVRSVLVAQQNKLVGIDIPAGVSSATSAAVQNAISVSFVTSFRVIMLIGVALALASALCSFLLIEGKPAHVDANVSRRSTTKSHIG